MEKLTIEETKKKSNERKEHMTIKHWLVTSNSQK